MSASRETMRHHEYLAELRALPPMPRVAREVMEALDDANAGFARIAELIQQDPGLTAKVMGLANSAYFARGRTICTLDQAIATVGMKRISTVVMGVALIKRFNPRLCPSFDLARYWYDASMTAWALEQLCNRDDDIEVAANCGYLAGLMYNIGLPALAHVAGTELSKVLQRRAMYPETSLAEHERAELNIDHHEAGAVVLENWGLPSEMIAIARYVGEEDYQGPYSRWVGLTRICVAWKRCGFEAFPEDQDLLPIEQADLHKLTERALKESERIRWVANGMV